MDERKETRIKRGGKEKRIEKEKISSENLNLAKKTIFFRFFRFLILDLFYFS